MAVTATSTWRAVACLLILLPAATQAAGQLSVEATATSAHTLRIAVTGAASGSRVEFFEGVVPLGAAATDQSGTARFPVSGLGAGIHTVHAVEWGSGRKVGDAIRFTVSRPVSNGFSAPATYATGLQPTVAASGDLDGDGMADIVLAGPGSVSVLLNAGTYFNAPVRFDGTPEPAAILIHDFNGDGRNDVAIADAHGHVAILLNTGGGNLAPARYFIAGRSPSALALADFNGDGIPDLAVANRDGNDVSILLGNGDGSFSTGTAIPTGFSPRALVVADFNGDDIPDLATANFASNDVTVLLGNGKGGFQQAGTFPAGAGPAALATADFNEDGAPDLAAVDETDGTAVLLLGDGNGGFLPVTIIAPASVLTAGDWDGDGHVDLILEDRGAVRVQRGRGDGTFAAGQGGVTGPSLALLLNEFDNGGRLDVAVAGRSGVVVVLSGAQGAGAAATITATAGSNQSAAVNRAFATLLQAVVKDSQGNPVPNVAVTFSAPDTGASGKFFNLANVAGVFTDSSGVATAPVFTANLTLGSFTVTASASGTNTVSYTFTNTLGSGARIVALTGSQSAAIGTTFSNSPQAIVYNADSLGIGGVSVTFTAPAGAGATGSFAGGSSSYQTPTDGYGVAAAPAFTANTRIGTYTVTAAASGISGTISFSYTNTAGPPHLLSLDGLSSTGVGTAFANGFVVTVQDANANLVSNTPVTFTVPSSGAGGVFSNGSNTFTLYTNNQGVVTAALSANLTYGSYTLTATAGTAVASKHLSNDLTGTHTIVSAGSNQSAVVGNAFAINLQALVLTADLQTVTSAPVVFTSPTSGAGGTFSGNGSSYSTSTSSSGVAAANTFTANFSLGSYTVTALQTGGSHTPASFSLTNTAGPPQAVNISVVPHTGVGSSFGPISVQVTDAYHNEVPNTTVVFTVPSAGASAKFSNNSTTFSATTDGFGEVVVTTLTANLTAGSYSFTATAGSASASTTLSNDLSSATVAVFAGSGQTAAIGLPFATNLQAIVTTGGLPVANAGVTFNAPAPGIGTAGGTFSNGSSVFSASTNASGIATASTFTANSTLGSYTVKASVLFGLGMASFSLTNSNTVAVVVDSSIGPTVTVDGATFTGDQTYTWIIGSQHSISTTSPQSGPGAQYAFTFWSDNGAISHVFTVPDAARTVVSAYFSAQYQLTTAVNPPGAGTINQSSGTYFNAGNWVSLTATAQPGYVFTGWSNNVQNPASASTSIALYSPQTVTANFAPAPNVQLTISVNPPGGGTVSQASGQYFTPGSTVPLTATAQPGYAFAGWTGNVAGASSASTSIVMNGPQAVTANFTPISGFQTITFAPLAARSWTGAPFSIGATAGSGLAVHFSAGPPSVCSVFANTVTILGEGACSVQATQNGNGFWVAAVPVTRTFTVTGSPSGTLAAAGSPIGVGTVPAGAAAGDFNGDGRSDLAILNAGDATVTVLLGNGSGGFAPAPGSPFAVGNNPVSVAAGDFNGDGKQDLVIANSLDDTVTVLLGDGTGGFTPAPGSPFVAGHFPVSVAVADLNGDGNPDLVIADFGSSKVTVLLGNGAGGFTQAPGSPFAAGSGPASVAVGDFNADGLPDIAVADLRANQVMVFLGNGAGGFSPSAKGPFSVGNSPYSLAVSDFNKDGQLDLVVANSGDATATVLLGDGSGGFTASPQSPLAVGNQPSYVVVGDLDGDGNPDAAVVNEVDSTVTVLLGNGAGGFTATTGGAFAVGYFPVAAAAADFNLDGRLDLATANSGDNTVTVLSGALAPVSAVLSTTSPASVSYGTGVPLTLTVAETGPAFAPFTGTANFLDGGEAIGATAQSASPYAFTASSLTGGSHTLTATYNGDGRTAAAASNNSIVIQVTGQPQMIAFGPLGNATYGDAPVTVGATASSGLPVGFASNSSAICTVAGSTVTIVGAGVCSISASQVGNAGYLPAAAVTQTFTVARQTETVAFNQLPQQPLGVAPFTIGATASSGLPVGFASNSQGLCTVSGSTVTLAAMGTCSITASQPGNANYLPATSVTQTFTVGPQLQSIAFNQPPARAYGAAPFTIGATASSGLPVGFVSNSSLACAVAGSTVTVLAPGTCSITARQTGNAAFAAAASVTRSFAVNSLPSGTLGVSTGSPFSVGSAGSVPAGAAVGDFNGDGKMDLVFPNSGDNTVAVLLGNGSGGFTPAPGSPFNVGNIPASVAVGDFNLDGKPDLAIVNLGDNQVVVMLGDGTGRFTPASGSPFAAGAQPISVAAGDFNNDGSPDLVIANLGPGKVTVLLGNGLGGFTPASGSPFAAGAVPISVLAGDFNGDGNLDLAVADAGLNAVSVLLGDGTGRFSVAANSPFPVGNGPQSVALGDFNGDGHLDLVVPNCGDNTVTVLLGGGASGFVAASGSPFPVGNCPVSAVVGDFDGDGHQDLAVVNGGDNTVTVLLGNGSGSFIAASGVAFPAGIALQLAAAGDFNGDGKLDLAVADSGNGTVAVFLGASVPTSSVLSTTSPATITPGQSVPLTLTLSDAGTAFAPPTGTVTFFDGSTPIGTAAQSASPYTFTAQNVAAGSHTFAANYGGDNRSAPSVSNSIVIQSGQTSGQTQTITFGGLSNMTFGAAPFAIAATASSGLPVSFTSTTLGICTVSGSTVTIIHAGACSITANQVGNAVFAPAPPAIQGFTVLKATPVITWAQPAAITFGGALGSGQLNATANVPGTFVYTPAVGVVLPVGNGQTLSVAFTPADAIDYTTASASTTISVNPAQPAASGVNLVVTTVLTRSGGNIVVQLTIANTGGKAAANVTLTSVKVGTVSGTPLPQTVGMIGAGASVQASVTVPGSVGASGAASSLTVSGTYTGGSFSSAARITLP